MKQINETFDFVEGLRRLSIQSIGFDKVEASRSAGSSGLKTGEEVALLAGAERVDLRSWKQKNIS
ncbi:MAG: hypothetical protein QFX31_01465 [Methanothrix sp.]|uniref:hypothetical protein n=1 Tax=Methanothrix sp. TaxID=90426 RepID=UPI0032AF2B2C|nr:hypothetical protein [Methanothrix sp.]